MKLKEWCLQEGEGTGTASGGAVTTPPPAAVVESSDDTADTGDTGGSSAEEFAALNKEFDTEGDEGEAVVTTPVVAPAAPAQPVVATPPVQAAQPAVTPPVTTPSTAAAPTTPVVPALQQASTTVAEPVAQPAPAAVEPQVTEQQRQEQLTALRTAEGTRLEQLYAVTGDDVAMLQTEPERVMPRLAAKLHMEVLDAVLNGVMSSMPRVVESMMTTITARQKAENEFYDMWPALKKPEYRNAVGGAVATYRSSNPTASREEVMRAAGLQVMIANRLPLPPELLNTSPAAPTVAAPIQPAGPGGGAQHRIVASSGNAFEVLANEFLDEDASP